MAEPDRPSRPVRIAKARSPADQSRLDMMKAIRAACRRQQIDDDTRKAIQLEKIGKASMADMTPAELGQLLDHLNRHWAGPMGHRAHIGKIKALWWTLYWLGEVHDPSEKAISAFVERQTGMAALRFLDHRSAASVIEALKKWAERAGVLWPSAEETEAQKVSMSPCSAALHERQAVLAAIGRELTRRRIIRSHYLDYVQKALGLVPNHYFWTAKELDTAIRLLGKRLRRAKEAD